MSCLTCTSLTVWGFIGFWIGVALGFMGGAAFISHRLKKPKVKGH